MITEETMFSVIAEDEDETGDDADAIESTEDDTEDDDEMEGGDE